MNWNRIEHQKKKLYFWWNKNQNWAFFSDLELNWIYYSAPKLNRKSFFFFEIQIMKFLLFKRWIKIQTTEMHLLLVLIILIQSISKVKLCILKFNFFVKQRYRNEQCHFNGCTLSTNLKNGSNTDKVSVIQKVASNDKKHKNLFCEKRETVSV